ncbi:MAG: TonB-dependent receptor, partial [Proteobacteria bacterium]|nr:TonB-dependent receptor [Pseudomonadota bacterium]
DSWSGALHVDYSFANDYLLTSITSFRKLDSAINDVISTEAQTRAILSTGATDAILIAPAANDFDEDSETFTQEYRITSPSGNALEWVAGVFYLQEDVRRNETVNLGLLQRDDNNVVSVLAPPGESGDDQNVSVESIAIFAQATYEIVDGWELTLGLRYTEDEKDISRVGTADGIVVAVPFAVKNSATFDEWTPKAVISYLPTDDLMFFASYSRGFKSGGFQGRGTSDAAVREPFDPETADAYEFGMKATFFDGRLQINPTVFHTDFDDLQVVELLRPAGSPPGTTSTLITQNAANAEIDGFEFEYSWYPVDGLTLSGSATFLDAEFTEFFAPAGFESEAGGALTDRVGNKLSKSPDFAMSQLIRYEWDVPGLNGTLAAQGEYIHKDLMFQDAANNPDVATPEYDVVNLSLAYHRDGDHDFGLTFWIKNVADEDYLLAAFAQDGGGRAIPAAPRTFGLTLLWSY